MKMDNNRKIGGAVDSISNLPDEILQQHILCYIPTKVSITTSLLSRRWRHVWCKVPSLSLDVDTLTKATSIHKSLTRYTAPKTTSFHLAITIMTKNIPHIDRLIKFAMSDNVENLSLDFSRRYYEYNRHAFVYNTSSVKQLNINLGFSHMIVPHECTVSWTSLQKLSLSCCSIRDDYMANILSGCPVLETLTLCYCTDLHFLDLRKFPRLRILEVKRNLRVEGPSYIVAPHIHCLKLLNSQLSCTLVDVSSLTEAKLDICYVSMNPDINADFLQGMVLEMLEKIKNVEKLTIGRNFIQILSIAEIRGVPFPMLNVKALTLNTKICQYVIPGIERLLQISPDLKKLTVCGRTRQVPVKFLDIYLELKGFNVNNCWRSKDGVSWNENCMDANLEHVTSFVELMLKNIEKLDKMVVLLDERYLNFKIEDLTATLSHNNNVTIVLSSTSKPMTSEEW